MPKPLITLSHSGKQHSYHVAAGLQALDALDCFYTSSYITSPAMQKWLLAHPDNKISNLLLRRFEVGLAAPKVKAAWHYEIKETILRKLYGKTTKAQNAIYARDIAFDANVAKILPKRPSNMYWGFQGSCWLSLQAAKKAGKLTIAELATAHVTASKKILGEEKLLHPDFADSLDNLVFPPNYEARLQQEPHLADVVLAASAFTRQTLLDDGVPSDKIHLLPLGFSLAHIPYHVIETTDIESRPLRVLYAGTLTQRKGIKYLLEAMQQLGYSAGIELTCIGGIQGSGEGLQQYSKWFTHKPAVAQQEMFNLYANYDCLVLPTIFEGFGLVIVEALAAGLPVITTPNSMGPDVITNGYNGYLIPIRQTDAIADALMRLRQLDSNAYLQMRINARNSVMPFTWEAYRLKLATFVDRISK